MIELMSYGITARALQILTGSDTLPTEIPSGWFNWQYIKKTDSGEIAINRLQLLNVDVNGDEVEIWNRNAIKVADCVLVYSPEDNPKFTDHLPSLNGSTVLQPVGYMQSELETEEQNEVLCMCRNPDDFFTDDWDSVRQGSDCGSLEAMQRVMLPLSLWFAFGLGLEKFIQHNTDSWWGRHDERMSKSSLQWSWNNTEEDLWPWSLDNPCTVDDIPSLADHGYIAYYPMRQMPCCGIAIDTEGKLHTIGALPTEPDGSWAFDDGSIRQAFEQKAQELLAIA